VTELTDESVMKGNIGELTGYFLRLGLLGFGGPVALVGQIERELLAERNWLSKEQMREAIAVCQSLPRPLAIQVGIYISYLRAGFWGAWAFIFPNFLIVAALGALYVHLGDLKPVTAVFYGVSPAVIALILHSCYRLAKLGMAVAAVRPCGHHHDLRRLSRAGFWGSLVSTVGIFFPSFILILIAAPMLARHRGNANVCSPRTPLQSVQSRFRFYSVGE
jgi:chromate transport protein ChrA